MFADDRCAGRKIRSFDDPDKIINVAVRLINQPYTGIDRFTKIMRRNRGCHSNGDTVRSVDQEVRNSGWEYYRLLLLTVVVVHKIDGVLFDVSDHLQRKRRHSCFGIS